MSALPRNQRVLNGLWTCSAKLTSDTLIHVCDDRMVAVIWPLANVNQILVVEVANDVVLRALA